MTFTPRVPASRTDRTGLASAAIAAIVFGAAYPVTAIALRSFQPVALAALTGTLALAVIVLLAVVGPLSRPRSEGGGWRYGSRGILGVLIALLVGRGPVLLLIELLREPNAILPSSPEPAAVVALALLVVGPSTAAQIAVLASVKRVSARRTSAALLLTPLASALIAAMMLNERLASVEIVGAALVLTGIAGAGGALEFIVGGRNRKSGRLPGRPRLAGCRRRRSRLARGGADPRPRLPPPLIGFCVARLAERQPPSSMPGHAGWVQG